MNSPLKEIFLLDDRPANGFYPACHQEWVRSADGGRRLVDQPQVFLSKKDAEDYCREHVKPLTKIVRKVVR